MLTCDAPAKHATNARCCGCTPHPAVLRPFTKAQGIALLKRARRVIAYVGLAPYWTSQDRRVTVYHDGCFSVTKRQAIEEVSKLPGDAVPVISFHIDGRSAFLHGRL